MSPVETVFAFGFVLSFAVILLAIWWYYLPKVISLYRFLVHQWEQPSPEGSFPKLRKHTQARTIMVRLCGPAIFHN